MTYESKPEPQRAVCSQWTTLENKLGKIKTCTLKNNNKIKPFWCHMFNIRAIPFQLSDAFQSNNHPFLCKKIKTTIKSIFFFFNFWKIYKNLLNNWHRDITSYKSCGTSIEKCQQVWSPDCRGQFIYIKKTWVERTITGRFLIDVGRGYKADILWVEHMSWLSTSQ